MARQNIPGIALAMAIDNRLIHSKSYGTADLEHGVPVKATTAFRTASVAKPLTAAAVMALVEDGAIDLDTPVRTYCPAWPENHPAITLRQVLGHLAGIRHYTKRGESTGTTHYFSVDDSLALFKDDPLLHEPGARYLYSTYGFSLAACAIEGAAGKPFETVVRERVFARAGMTRTRLDRVYEIIPDRARGYQVLTQEVFDSLPPSVRGFAKVGAVYNADLHDTSMKVAGGGFVSTAEDLVRFGMALNTGALLKKDSVERMWTEQQTPDGKGTGYGLGFGVTPAQEGIRRLSHSGNQAGAASLLVILPEVGVTYAIMTNREDAELGPISRGIANALRDTFMPKQ
jgi:CubicO group peptidase (beta-lactamase class C family)